MPTHVPVFLLTTWLLAMLPGAGQALMLRQTLAGGRRLAAASIAGTCTGIVVWATTAAAGLSAIMLANPAAYAVVRALGGIVLFWLGVNTLLSLRRHGPTPTATATSTSASLRAGYVAGLATNLGNPKAGVFALSLLPQFVTASGPVFLSSVVLGGLWSLVTACWYILFTWAVDRGRALVSRPAIHRGLHMVTGGVLLVLGIAVAVGI
jgi:threonine/homoserine/homoserine lactone efflux protein